MSWFLCFREAFSESLAASRFFIFFDSDSWQAEKTKNVKNI